MKNKSLKLFLLLGVIILSLFAFASCKQTDDEAVTPNQDSETSPSEESENTGDKFRIHDTKLLDCIINENKSNDTPSIDNFSKIEYFYNKISKDNSLTVLRFYVLDQSNIICGYVTPKTLEKIKEIEIPDYYDYTISNYGYNDLFLKYKLAMKSGVINLDDDEIILYDFDDESAIPEKCDSNTLAFVCTLYKANFKNSQKTIIANNNGEIRYPPKKSGTGVFYPNEKSDYANKGKSAFILSNYVSDYMSAYFVNSCAAFLFKEPIHGIEAALVYPKEYMSENFQSALGDIVIYNWIELTETDFYSNKIPSIHYYCLKDSDVEKLLNVNLLR